MGRGQTDTVELVTRRSQPKAVSRPKRDDYKRIYQLYEAVEREWTLDDLNSALGGGLHLNIRHSPLAGAINLVRDGGYLGVQGEHIFYNLVGKIIDRDDLPPKVQRFVNQEREWIEDTLPPDSGKLKLRRIFSKKESIAQRYLRARWTDAIRNINEETASGRALLNYFEKRYKSKKRDKWLEKPPSDMQKDLLLLDGTRALLEDEELKMYSEFLHNEGERLRQEATVAGKEPTDALFLLPHSGWMDPRSQAGNFDLYAHEMNNTMVGLHQGDTAFVFVDTVLDRTFGTSIDRKEQILHIARHELIHDTQKDWNGKKNWEVDFKEALTENINLLKSHPPYRASPGYKNRKKLPIKVGREFEMTVLENLIIPRVGREAYPDYIEALSVKSFSAIERELSKLFPEGIESAWKTEAAAEIARHR